jgi:integrase
LKVSDIESQRIVVHIRESKGGRDRDVMLSPKLLEALRDYWRGLRRKPKEWLFPGNRWHTASYPVTTKVLWTACQIAAERVGLEHKNILIACSEVGRPRKAFPLCRPFKVTF